MSHRLPIRVTERHQFDALIDARSPAEFALDHVPGAINCPVLSNEERAQIGTIYKQVSPFDAKRLGAAMVSANLARHLHETFADKPANWKPLVYCWRGGLRSGSMVTWLRLVGWDAQQMAGGYKSFRGHVISQLEDLVPQMDMRIVCGATGSAKTRVLHALEQAGEQVLDLEGYASHKGSLLGNLPGIDQPSQKRFETLISEQLESFDFSRPIYLEGESAKIGRLGVPLILVERMRKSPVIEVRATPEARLEYLLRDYAYLGDDPEDLIKKLSWLKEMQGNETVHRWQAWAQNKELSPLFAELMAKHYDPHYERSQSNHFDYWGKHPVLETQDLSDAGIAKLTEQTIALEKAAK